jgi:hypothetical protein
VIHSDTVLSSTLRLKIRRGDGRYTSAPLDLRHGSALIVPLVLTLPSRLIIADDQGSVRSGGYGPRESTNELYLR